MTDVALGYLGWFLVTLAGATAFVALVSARAPLACRAGFACGLLAVTSVVIFGSMWPSPDTIIALVCLPCALVFLAGIVRPSLSQRRWVRVYGTIAVVLATASLGHWAWWELAGEPSGHAAYGSRPLLRRSGP